MHETTDWWIVIPTLAAVLAFTIGSLVAAVGGIRMLLDYRRYVQRHISNPGYALYHRPRLAERWNR